MGGGKWPKWPPVKGDSSSQDRQTSSQDRLWAPKHARVRELMWQLLLSHLS